MPQKYVPTFEEYSALIKSTVIFSNLQDRNPKIWIKTLDHGAYMIPLNLKNSVAANVSKSAMQKIGNMYNKAMHDAFKPGPDGKPSNAPNEKIPDISYDAYFDQSEFQSLKDAAYASTQPEPEAIFRRNLKKHYNDKTKW